MIRGALLNGMILGPIDRNTDEWGNKTATLTHYKKDNHVENLYTAIDLLDDMEQTWDILSRTANFDSAAGFTTFKTTIVEQYADPTDRRYSLEAQSGREPITAHPRFDDIAGTPVKPNLTNAVWVKSDDAQGTMKFVELKGTYAGLEQFISGSGTILKEQWIDTWAGSKPDDEVGKIRYPIGSGIWGGTTAWLLIGFNAEPYGKRYKFTRIYRQASPKASREGGWSTTFYS